MPMHSLVEDLRYALRQLRRSPAFAAAAILTLALGIGANTAIFSLLDQALLRSLPIRDPRQLVILEGTGKAWQGHSSSHGGDEEAYFSYPMYRDLRDKNHAFEGLIATAPADIGFASPRASQSGRAELVSGNYFSVLGVEAALGRPLTQADDTQPEANPVAVLSFDFWKNKLGADPKVVGETVSVNGHPFQVIGVAAQRFRSAIWGETPDLFVPMSMLDEIVPGKGKRLTDHTDKWMNILGRLKPGESRAQAQVAMQPLWHALRAEELKNLGHRSQHFTDEFLTRSRMLVVPGARGFSYNRDSYQKPLLAVMAMALLVLVMAAVNVASLLLVRSAGRVREFSVRYALGAGRARITQQLLLEGMLIGIAGGAVGILFAPAALRGLAHQLTGDQAYGPFTATIDLRLLLFNFAIALVVSVVFSMAPILQLRRADLTTAIRQQSATGAMPGFRRAVVCLQIGLSVLLLVGASLFVRTMQKLRQVDVGFSTTHLVTFGINPMLSGYAPERVPALHQQVIDTLAALPGVEAVAANDNPELDCCASSGNVTVSGYTAPPDSDFDVEHPFVSPSFFSTMQIPLLGGRIFTDGDTSDHPQVAIVNEAFVRHFCGSVQACLHRRMTGGGGRVNLDIEIVGVVRDARNDGLREEVVPTYFRPLKQDPNPGQLFLYLRTALPPEQALTSVRAAMHRLDPALSMVALRTMEQQIDDDLSNERMVTLLAVFFGVLATLLAGVGLYGVLAYSTAQRTREIGIRIALGSSRTAVARIILADVFTLAAIGILLAVPVAFALSKLLRSQLFGVTPADPVSLIAAVLLVSIVALLAALIPARRAATIDPVTALRTE
jgi:putative ABC transport system permease protein